MNSMVRGIEVYSYASQIFALEMRDKCMELFGFLVKMFH